MNKRAKILLVDDKEANLVALKSALKKVNAELICALSAKEALKHLLEHEFALILLDVNMPEISGYELAAILRDEPSTKETPIIFISAIDKDEVFELKGYSSGAVDFIYKPINKVILVSKVQVFLELYYQKVKLEFLKHEAEKSSASKAAFLANMSHEIRTPMNSVLGFTELLEETPLNDEQSEHVDHIKKSGKVLLSIINDILDFSKIESGKMTLEQYPVNIKLISENAIAIAKASKDCSDISFIFDCKNCSDIHFLGDETRITQILINLLNNSIKFTDKGTITLKVESQKTDSGKVKLKFSVKDTGIGIPESKLKTIFQSFSQADVSTTRKFGGTGLGLSIAKSFINLMGGDIEVDSEFGSWTCFSFDITLDKNMTKNLKKAATTCISIQDYTGKKVLVVEDNKANQKLLNIILKKYHLHVDIADDGLKALTFLKDHQVDIIFMDIQMPNMDGIKCTRELRKNLPDTPVIALTADVIAEEKKVALKAGMNYFLTKPINRAALDETLNTVFGEKS